MKEVIKSYGDFNLRAIELDKTIWFHARTVAKGLGYANPSEAYQNHCKSLKLFDYSTLLESGFKEPHPKGEYFMKLADLNRLIMKSSLPSAEAIQDWVNEDVIPSLLTTGSYSMQPNLPKTHIEAVEAYLNELKRSAKLQAERDHITTLFDQELSFCSIIRAATYLGVHEKVFDWRVLKPWSLKNGFEVKRVPSPRYGYQVLYPIKAFMECYPQYDFSKIEPDKIPNKSSLAITHCIKLERLL